MSQDALPIFVGDADLWRLFKAGDWQAYTLLYKKHFKLLNNYGYKFTKDADLIEDAVHDLFVKLWTNKANLSDPVSVKNYLFKSLRGDLLRKMESHVRFVNLEEDGEHIFPFEVSFDQLMIATEEELDLQQKIKSVIQTLPARQQEIIFLRFYEGLNYDEIAEIMDITVSSTYKLLYKSINSLHGILKTPKIMLIFAILSAFQRD